jgi:hypothetical protein
VEQLNPRYVSEEDSNPPEDVIESEVTLSPADHPMDFVGDLPPQAPSPNVQRKQAAQIQAYSHTTPAAVVCRSSGSLALGLTGEMLWRAPVTRNPFQYHMNTTVNSTVNISCEYWVL